MGGSLGACSSRRWRRPRTGAFVSLLAVAVFSTLLVACSGSSSKSAGPTETKLTVTSPGYGALVRGPEVPISAQVTGGLQSVKASVNEDPMSSLSSHGGQWTGDLKTSAGFVPGANTVIVRALGSKSDVLAKEVRRVYVLASPVDLGLAALDASNDDSHRIQVKLARKVAQVNVSLNGRTVTPSLSPRPGTQTLTLGAADGLHPGANTVDVTAVMADGAYQDAHLTLTVPDGAPIAGAGGDVTGRAGIPVRLTGAAQTTSGSSGAVTYHWDVVKSPAGSHPTLQNADSQHPSLVGDVKGDYLVRVRVSQAGHPSTSDEVTVALGDAASRPLGSHLDTQLASINGVALDGAAVTDGSGHQSTVPAGQQGAVLVLLERSNLAVISVDYQQPGGWQSLVDDVNAATADHPYEGVVAILSSPSGIGGPTPNTSWEPLLQALGVDNANDQPNWDKNVQAGNPFSFVSVIYGTNDIGAEPVVWRTNHNPAAPPPGRAPGIAAATSAANLSGYLQLSNGGAGAHTFVPDAIVPIDTQSQSTATTNTMTVGACAANPAPNSTCTPLTSPPIVTCQSSQPTGGFHVVVFYASTLSVLQNASFATNTGCGADGTDGDNAGIASMVALLKTYAAGDGTDDHLVAVQSIGKPRPASHNLDVAWSDLAAAVGNVGGAASAVAQMGTTSEYSLLGADSLSRPGSDRPFGAAATTDAPSKYPTSRQSAVLTPNHRNDLAPTSTGKGAPFPSGLGAIAYAPSTPWPVPCASSACPSGSTPEGQQKALDFITRTTAPTWNSDLTIGPSDGACYEQSHPSIRDAYCDTGADIDWDAWGRHLCKPQTSGGCTPLAPPPTKEFTAEDWHAVVTQLAVEAHDVKNANTAIGHFQTYAQDIAGGAFTSVNLSTAETNILTALKVSANDRDKGIHSVSFWLDVVSAIYGIIWAATAFFGPEAAAAGGVAGIISESAGVAGAGTSTFLKSGGGAGLSGRVESTARDLSADLAGRYAYISAQGGWLGEMAVTDWGKLSTLAKSTLASGDSAFKTKVLNTMATGAIAWLDPLILGAAYSPIPLNRFTFPPNSNCGTDEECHALLQQQAPYAGDAYRFSCQSYSDENYFPFTGSDDEQYLAVPSGGSPSRYVLSNVPPDPLALHHYTPGNPTDRFVQPDNQILPPVAPDSVVAPMFAPLADLGGIAATNPPLGLFKPDVYEHTFRVSNPKLPPSPNVFQPLVAPPTGTVTCRNAGPAYARLAAVSPTPGTDQLFAVSPQSPSSLVWYSMADGRWQVPKNAANQPVPPPGTPDANSGLAAVAAGPNNTYVFFVQGGQVMYDQWNGKAWSQPAALPGSPKKGTPLAATISGPSDIHVYFNSNNGLANDWFDANGWHGPGPLPGSADDGYGFAATEDIPGQSMHFFYVHDGKLTNDYWTPAQGWNPPGLLPGSPDKGSPLAAVSQSPGAMQVVFVQGGQLSNITYNPPSPWIGPNGLATQPDAGNGVAAVVVSPGVYNVYAVSDGGLVVNYYNNFWNQSPLLFPR